jgi:hypothetical protein
MTGRRADVAACSRLVQRVVRGGIPRGTEFDACRAVLSSTPNHEAGFHALCTLLEGALADPDLDIDDTQILVPLLRQLARGTITVRDLL